MKNIRILAGIAMLSLFLVAGNACAAFPSTSSHRTYAPGDLIMSQEDRHFLWEKEVPMVSRECGENMTLLKEGYMFLFDNINEIYIPAKDSMGESKRYADFSIYKNDKIVKQMKVKEGDFFYYNKTIDGKEYTIIKFKLNYILSADGLCGGYWAQIQPFFQYSDGTGGQDIRISHSDLSPLEEWNRTFSGFEENTIKAFENTGDYNYINQVLFRFTSIEMSVQETKDGGFIMARNYIPASSKEWLQTPILMDRTDTKGNELWNKTRIEPKTRVYSIEQTDDNGFVIAGEIPTLHYNINAWFEKIDSNGSEEWNRTFGEKYEYNEYPQNSVHVDGSINSSTSYFVSKTKNGGYFLLGTLGQEGHFGLIRTDPQGIGLWNMTLDLAVYIDRISSLAQTDDGGCIITSITRESDFGKYDDSKLIKLDSNGSEQWNKTFGGEYDDHFSSVRQTEDGGYIITGMTESYGHDAWLIKTDPNGDEQWNRTFYAGGGNEALDVRQTRDGFILAGRRISHEGNDALLIKTDPDGNELWSKTFGGERDDEALFVQQATDGGYILAGTTKSYGSGNKDGWLIKVSGEPNGTANASTVSPTGTLTTSPTLIMTAIPTEIHMEKPAEKAAGFQFALAITTLLIVYKIGRKRW